MQGRFGARIMCVALIVAGFLGAALSPLPAAATGGAALPHRSPSFAKAGITGSSYTGGKYGFTVKWDSAIWTPTDNSDASLNSLTLQDADGSQLIFQGGDSIDGSVGQCVSDLSRAFKAQDGVVDYARVDTGHTRLDVPKGAAANLYSFSYAAKGVTASALAYIECRQISKAAVLSIVYVALEPSYEAGLPTVADVIATLKLGKPAPSGTAGTTPAGGNTPAPPKKTPAAEPTAKPTKTSGPVLGKIGKSTDPAKATVTETPVAESTETPAADPTETPVAETTAPAAPKTRKGTPGLKGNVFTGRGFDYAVTFDDAVWTAKETKPGTGDVYTEGVSLEHKDGSNSLSFGTVRIYETFGEDTKGCLKTASSSIESSSSANFAEATTLDAPKTARGADGGLYSYSLKTNDGTELSLVEYLECRAVAGAKAVVVTDLYTIDRLYTDELAVWNDLLAGIKVGSAAKTTGGATVNKPPTTKKTPAATEEAGAATTFPDVSGSTFTSPAFGFTFTWPKSYTPLLATGDKNGDVVSAGDGTSIAILFSGTKDLDPAACLASQTAELEKSADVSGLAVVTDDKNQEISGQDDNTAFVLQSYTSKKNGDKFQYSRCVLDPTGTFMVTFIFLTPANAFNTSSADLTSMIDSITFN